MKKTLLAGLAIGMLTVGAVAVANAASVNVNFPSSTTSYHSTTNGDGTMSGGASAYMWTTGDYVTQNFTGVGLSSVDSLSVNFKYQNILASSVSETVKFFINGIDVGSFTAPGTNYSYTDYNITDTFNFASINGAGSYTLSMVLQDTMASGYGSIRFYSEQESLFTLGQKSPVPEPATMLLFGTGLAGLAVVRRKKA